MKNKTTICNSLSIINLREQVKKLIFNKKFQEAEKAIANCMNDNPHDPTAHNYMGVILEIQGDTINAMKHFRAASALDATYLPARFNIDILANRTNKLETLKMDIEDCPNKIEQPQYKLIYDEKGIGHIIRRQKNDAI